jgi:DNA primase large subunit
LVFFSLLGCPFKHFDREFLKQKLKQYGRSDDEVQQITSITEASGYQIACQRYFEMSHKTEEIIPVNHPNQYFEQSYRITHGHNPNKPKDGKNGL